MTLSRPGVIAVSLLAAAALTLSTTGCSSSRESAEADSMTANVGKYPPGPSPAWRPRVGVPAFKVTGGDSTAEASAQAGDQLTTLATKTNRFDMIERAQLDQPLNEQGLAGVVKEGEVAKQGQIRGVDLLFIGKITNLRVKAEKSEGGFNLGSIGGYFGAFDMNKSESKITVECGIDLRLVNPNDGSIAASDFGDFKRTDSLSSMGVAVLGYRNKADSTLELNKDNQGKILRLVIDETIKKMLPQIDAMLVAKAPKTN